MATRKPAVGTSVAVLIPFTEEYKTVCVVELLASQFVHEDEDGHIGYALYSGDWHDADTQKVPS